MGSITDEKSSRLDLIKWGVVIILLGAGVWANYHFREVAWSLRLAGWIVLACIAGLIALQTAFGHAVRGFGKEARMELRKVVWPTRQETVQTTFVVVGLVVVMALILWGVDSLLLWLVSLLTGRG